MTELDVKPKILGGSMKTSGQLLRAFACKAKRLLLVILIALPLGVGIDQVASASQEYWWDATDGCEQGSWTWRLSYSLNEEDDVICKFYVKVRPTKPVRNVALQFLVNKEQNLWATESSSKTDRLGYAYVTVNAYFKGKHLEGRSIYRLVVRKTASEPVWYSNWFYINFDSLER